jgi:hypothetical protein
MSSSILSKLDEMGRRVESLERGVQDLSGVADKPSSAIAAAAAADVVSPTSTRRRSQIPPPSTSKASGSPSPGAVEI